MSAPPRSRRLIPIGLSALDGRPMNRARVIGGSVWALFVLFPLMSAIGRHEAPLRRGVVIAGAAVFTISYIALIMTARRSWSGMRGYARAAGVLYGLMIAIAIALTSAGSAGWGFLFTYCAACSGLIAPAEWGFVAVGGCTVLAGILPALAGASGGTVLGFVASTAGIGLLIIVLRDLRLRNDELSQARAELAQLAVAQERERFARDLHDLLGHSLSVIALKAELAGRLVGTRPQDAASEIAELEHVARCALTEVREAVGGYRQPTLDDELEGARMALSAAGIAAEISRPAVSLSPPVEAVLAWTVREGATNVIRHSRAGRCVLRVTAGLASARVEVLDDGCGGAACNGHAGNGLRGLAERAERLHGRLEAGSSAEGGFRLAVSVPLQAP